MARGPSKGHHTGPTKGKHVCAKKARGPSKGNHTGPTKGKHICAKNGKRTFKVTSHRTYKRKAYMC